MQTNTTSLLPPLPPTPIHNPTLPDFTKPILMTYHTDNTTTCWIQESFYPVFKAIDGLTAGTTNLSEGIDALSASLFITTPRKSIKLDTLLPKLPLNPRWQCNLPLKQNPNIHSFLHPPLPTSHPSNPCTSLPTDPSLFSYCQYLANSFQPP